MVDAVWCSELDKTPYYKRALNLRFWDFVSKLLLSLSFASKVSLFTPSDKVFQQFIALKRFLLFVRLPNPMIVSNGV
jgi:hypothetical protein